MWCARSCPGRWRFRHRRPAFPAHGASGRARRQRRSAGGGARQNATRSWRHRKADVTLSSRRSSRRCSPNWSRCAGDGAVDDPELLPAASRLRSVKGSCSSAAFSIRQHRRRAVVRARDSASGARGAPRRKDLHRRQQRAGQRPRARHEDFIVTGYVPDVTSYFTGCRASIAPLRYGAGVKGKINLAMSYGLPVIATTPSIEGMHFESGRGRARRRRSAGLRGRDRSRLPGRETVGQARRRRARQHPQHFSRDVARSTITRLIALARGNGLTKAA